MSESGEPGGDGDGGDGGVARESAWRAPGCLGCGACCFSEAEHYVRVSGADWSRLGADADRWAQFVNNRAFMRMKDGHCAALRVVVGDPAIGEAPQFFCAIYERRPQVCRDLARGSAECEAEWMRKREAAKATALEVAESSSGD